MGSSNFIQESLKSLNDTYPILGEYVIAKYLDFALLLHKKHTHENKSTEAAEHFICEFKKVDVLKQYINGMLNWAEGESVIQSFNPKLNSEYYVYQTFRRRGSNNASELHEISKVLVKKQNYVFKGGPGIGKSTLMKHLINTSSDASSFIKSNSYYPFLLKCRDLLPAVSVPRVRDIIEDEKIENPTQVLMARLQNLAEKSYILINILSDLGFYIRFPKRFQTDQTFMSWVKELEAFFLDLADTHCILFLTDGFDEIQDAETKAVILEILNTLSLKCPNSNFIMTSRETNSVGSFPNTAFFEINFFKDQQLELFIDNWFSPDMENSQLLKSILKTRPYFDTLCRPLTLTFICALFERNNQDIPFKATEIYLQIVDLLIEKWEKENRLKRHSRYLSFMKEKKMRFLGEFAYFLTKHKREKEFTKGQLKSYLKTLLAKYKIPVDELEYLVAEIEDHTGLFIEVGYQKYCFSHFSIQEFLTGYHIFNIGSVHKSEKTLEVIPETLATCVALSSDPNEYFNEFYFEFLTKKIKNYRSQILRFLEAMVYESPDFQVSEEIGICFSSLYTGLISNKDNVNRIMEDSFIDKINIEEAKKIDASFDKIFKDITIQQSLHSALTYYEVAIEMNSSLALYVMKPFSKNSLKYPLPNFLLINQDHLKSIT